MYSLTSKVYMKDDSKHTIPDFDSSIALILMASVHFILGYPTLNTTKKSKENYFIMD